MSLQGFEHITIPSVEIVKHETAESIFHAFWSFGEDVPLDEILKGSAGGCDADGNEAEEMPMSELLEATKENGFWAFSDCPKSRIHVWDGSGLSERQMMILLGHEVGHILESGKLHEVPEVAEEQKADRYGVGCVITNALLEEWRKE